MQRRLAARPVLIPYAAGVTVLALTAWALQVLLR
jgi:hypothetical protein